MHIDSHIFKTQRVLKFIYRCICFLLVLITYHSAVLGQQCLGYLKCWMMKWVQNSDSKTHVKKLNPTARTDISNKTLWGIFESLRIVLVHTKMTIKKTQRCLNKEVLSSVAFNLVASLMRTSSTPLIIFSPSPPNVKKNVKYI